MQPQSEMPLRSECRQWLLTWARGCISAALGDSPPSIDARPPEVDALRGCFVSLHQNDGALRGCIGTFDASDALWRSVAQMAVAAATRDYRFEPLRLDELSTCVIEISALTARVSIAAEDIVVGEHGLWIACGGRSGVLLPQVASSNSWDRTTFLEHTCLKAGLPKDAWRHPTTTIEAFCAEVFSEASSCQS